MTDERSMFAALLNHIPATMQATRVVLSTTVKDSGKVLLPGADQVVYELTRHVSALNASVIILEDRLEKSEGRAGLPETAFLAILKEFNL